MCLSPFYSALQALYMLRQIRPSVCLSCPSHFDIVSKLGNAEGCGLHYIA